jgi:hypothetical protein
MPKILIKQNGKPADEGAGGPAKGQLQFYGGVSPRPNAPAASGLVSLFSPPHWTLVPAAYPNFSYHGGPVISCPQIYASFWGDQWISDPGHLTRAGAITQFLGDLCNSGYMNVLSQYGCGNGAGSGFFNRASFVDSVPSILNTSGIESIIQSLVDNTVIPQRWGTTQNHLALFIYLDDLTGFSDVHKMCVPGADFFGFHSYFVTTGGTHFYYAVIPCLSDDCLKDTCGPVCSLQLAETVEQRITQVTSHEFAEMLTNPEGNAWYAEDTAHENGDICNGETDTITVGSNTWTVQRQYSKTDDINSSGRTYCVTELANPLPKLSPGPSDRFRVSSKRLEELRRLTLLLPLPPITFHRAKQELWIDQSEVMTYVRRLFRPFHYSQLVPNLPEMFHAFADVLTMEEEQSQLEPSSRRLVSGRPKHESS